MGNYNLKPFQKRLVLSTTCSLIFSVEMISLHPICSSSWWFQPIWKIWTSNWIISPGFGVKIKHIWVATIQSCILFLQSLIWILTESQGHPAFWRPASPWRPSPPTWRSGFAMSLIFPDFGDAKKNRGGRKTNDFFVLPEVLNCRSKLKIYTSCWCWDFEDFF